MSILRWLARIAILAVALGIALAFAARFHDGPLGPLPGGLLQAGEPVREPVADWSFAADVPEIELQLAAQDRSRTVWVLVDQGRAYVPCSLGFPPGKNWYRAALQDGRATLRIDGRLYPVTLSKLDDPPRLEALREVARRKYPTPSPGGAEIWMFEVRSRSDSEV